MTMEQILEPVSAQTRSFDSWHFPMLNDRSRNEAMDAAIRAINVEGKSVLDIGTGAGLTAMMFARHGAKKIVTCEIKKQLFDIARENIDNNGYGRQVKIINKSSTAAIDDGDIDFTPDIIFTETLDCGVIGEGFHNISVDIKKVSGDRTIVIPSLIEQFGYIVDSESMVELNHVNSVCGFDLQALNRYRTKTYFPVRHHLHRTRALSDVEVYRTYDYLQQSPDERYVQVIANGSGHCHGLVSFFRAQFGNCHVTNDPRHHGHWHQAFHPIEKPITVVAGRRYRCGLNFFGSFSLSEV